MVGDVLYSCDLSAAKSPPRVQRPATKVVNNVRNLIQATKPLERNSDGGEGDGGYEWGGSGVEGGRTKNGLTLVSNKVSDFWTIERHL